MKSSPRSANFSSLVWLVSLAACGGACSAEDMTLDSGSGGTSVSTSAGGARVAGAPQGGAADDAAGQGGGQSNPVDGTGGTSPGVNTGPNSLGDDAAPRETLAVLSESQYCPEEVPHPWSECDSPSGTRCGYWFTREGSTHPEYSELYCAPDGLETRAWLDVVEDANGDCPMATITTGAPCSGNHVECPSLGGFACRCDGDEPEPAWACTQWTLGNTADKPEGFPENAIAVSLLTEADREAWCGWYSTQTGEGDDAPVAEDGYLTGAGWTQGVKFACAGCMSDISKAQCMANLGFSSCTATIGELTDCVETIRASCYPSPNGCAAYLAQPGCGETIVLSAALYEQRETATRACSIRVE